MVRKFCINDTYMVVDSDSGAVHKVDGLIYDILEYYKKCSNDDIVNILKDKYEDGIIREGLAEIAQLEENNLLFTNDEYISDVKILKSHPIVKALCLHISHDCNIRCKYCFASYGHFGGDRGLMTLEVGQKAIDFLIKNSGTRRNLEVDFFGGEPLLNFDTIKAIIRYAREKEKENNKNFRFTLTTNALLLNEEDKKYINENFYNVVLSIDGRKSVNDNMRVKVDGSGVYDEILPRIIDIAESRAQSDYYVRGTYTSYNLDFSKDIIHLADLGFKQIALEPVVAEASQDYAIREEHLPQIFLEYEKLAKECVGRLGTDKWFNFFHFMIDLDKGPCIAKRLSGCGAGADYLAITPTGDIYPCHQFVHTPKYKMGSVFEDKINTDLQNEFKGCNVYKNESCKNCWAKFYCSGGCHANAYNSNGDIHTPYRIGCELQKKRIECALYICANKGEIK